MRTKITGNTVYANSPYRPPIWNVKLGVKYEDGKWPDLNLEGAMWRDSLEWLVWYQRNPFKSCCIHAGKKCWLEDHIIGNQNGVMGLGDQKVKQTSPNGGLSMKNKWRKNFKNIFIEDTQRNAHILSSAQWKSTRNINVSTSSLMTTAFLLQKVTLTPTSAACLNYHTLLDVL